MIRALLASLVLILPQWAIAGSEIEHAVYGSNPMAGHYFEHDGIRLYYEVYGRGQPLLLIHGNGGSIWGMKRQIDYFKGRYQVIAMDSRDHGRSGDSPRPLTFEAMTDDLAALLDHLHVGPVLVLGWSDGGIEALLLGMRHPGKVNKIAAMAANLTPEGLAPEVIEIFRTLPKSEPGQASTRAARVTDLDRYEPRINTKDLEIIKAPTLILAGDHDAIADEHTIEIFHHIPNGQLAIFPGATHMIPVDDPKRFNDTVETFFRTTFRTVDRMGDLEKTSARLKAEFEAESRAARYE